MRNVLLKWVGNRTYRELMIGKLVVATISGEQEDNDGKQFWAGWIGDGDDVVYDTGRHETAEEVERLIEEHIMRCDSDYVELVEV